MQDVSAEQIAADIVLNEGLDLNPTEYSDLLDTIESVQKSMARLSQGERPTEPPAARPHPEQVGPREGIDEVYTVEHVRDGAWRLHVEMTFSSIYSYVWDKAQEIKRNFPDAQVRVVKYARLAQPSESPAGEKKR